jgi:uncharacterized protein (DUF2384 family)
MPNKSLVTPEEARVLMDMLFDLFGDYKNNEDMIMQWLCTPCLALGNRVPAEVIYGEEDGYQQVIQVIGRLLHGIPL